MRIRVTTAATHKAGNDRSEMEDAWFPTEGYETEAWRFRAAVSDGATETSYSREWAHELARGYATGRLEGSAPHSGISRLRARWLARVGGRPLPWYAEEKLRMGAFAALVGITIFDQPVHWAIGSSRTSRSETGRRWRATSAGDSCLFHVRRGRLLMSFPVNSSAQFTNRPRLLSSHPGRESPAKDSFSEIMGSWRTEDRFLLTTDALAAWLLRSYEGGRDSLCVLENMVEEPARFSAWINRLRRRGDIRNDDVTAMVVSVTATGP